MIKKVALVIAHDGFHAVEYGVPKKLFQEAGFDVVTVSNKSGIAHAHDGSKVAVDKTLDTIDPLHYDGLVFIGGPGALENLDNDLSYRVIQKAVMAEKLVAAICSAPRILAKAGALAAKTATGWDKDHKLKEIFDAHAVIYDDESSVVTDGHIVTAEGPSHAEAFAHAIMAVI
jgi:protease I